MPLNWRDSKAPVDLELPSFILLMRKMLTALDRILGYTEPRGVTASWNPGATLAAGASVGVDVAVPDVQLGDMAIAGFSVAFTEDRCNITAKVKSAGVVRVVIYNQGAGSVALGAGLLAVNAWRA